LNAKIDDHTPANLSKIEPIDTWNWYHSGAKPVRKCETNTTSKCLASPGLTMLIDNWVFWNRYPKFDSFDVYYKALEAAFNALGDAKAKNLWKGFKGPKILQDNETEGKEKLTYKLELDSNGVNLDDIKSAGLSNFEPTKDIFATHAEQTDP